jgi:hypothetical protein
LRLLIVEEDQVLGERVKLGPMTRPFATGGSLID